MRSSALRNAFSRTLWLNQTNITITSEPQYAVIVRVMTWISTLMPAIKTKGRELNERVVTAGPVPHP